MKYLSKMLGECYRDEINLTSSTLIPTMYAGRCYTNQLTKAVWVLVEGVWEATSSKEKTKSPILSGVSNANEGQIATITISNYDMNNIYYVEVDKGSYTREGDVISWTLPLVATNIYTELKVFAIRLGKDYSKTSVFPLMVNNVAYTSTEELVYDNTSMSSFANVLNMKVSDNQTLDSTNIDKSNILDSSKTSTTSKLYLDFLTIVEIGETIVTDEGTSRVSYVSTVVEDFYVLLEDTLPLVPTFAYHDTHRAISQDSNTTEEIVSLNDIVSSVNASELQDNTKLGSNTTQKVYVNNELYDVRKGEFFATDNNEIFEVGVVGKENENGTYYSDYWVETTTPLNYVPGKIFPIPSLQSMGTAIENIDVSNSHLFYTSTSSELMSTSNVSTTSIIYIDEADVLAYDVKVGDPIFTDKGTITIKEVIPYNTEPYRIIPVSSLSEAPTTALLIEYNSLDVNYYAKTIQPTTHISLNVHTGDNTSINVINLTLGKA